VIVDEIGRREEKTSDMMSGSCWLPLMKPITRRPVARSTTAAKRSRISS
jgi:hypothetical protein